MCEFHQGSIHLDVEEPKQYGIQWSPYLDYNWGMAHYSLRYKENGTSEYLDASAIQKVDTFVPLHSMKPGRTYVFEIHSSSLSTEEEVDTTPTAAEVLENEQEEQSPCLLSTPPEAPETPTNFHMMYKGRTEYLFTWEEPEDNGQKIELYRLSLRQPNSTTTDLLAQSNETRISLKIPSDQAHGEVLVEAKNSIGFGSPAQLSIIPPLDSAQDINMSMVVAPVLLTVLAVLLLLVFCGFWKQSWVKKKSRRSLLRGIRVFFSNSVDATSLSGGQMIVNNGSEFDSTEMRHLRCAPSNSLSQATNHTSLPLSWDSVQAFTSTNLPGNAAYETDPLQAGALDSIHRVPHIASSQLRFLRYIGCGAFGKVWEGEMKSSVDEDTCLKDKKAAATSPGVDAANRRKVALKLRNPNVLSDEEFHREAVLMFKYQHPNIVRLIGVSLDRPGQHALILELMEQGNLRDYLHSARPHQQLANQQAGGAARKGFMTQRQFNRRVSLHGVGSNVKPSQANSQLQVCPHGNDATALSPSQSGSLSTTTTALTSVASRAYNSVTCEASLDLPTLMNILLDVARGCQYLEKNHFVHRDIAARNCLVSHLHASGRIVKLSDFGLARDIYHHDYYRKKNEPKLPVRWMSPEAIRDGIFTCKSDVWAFAITCWEVLTMGADPFYGNVNMEVVSLVLSGQLLEKPENCPQELYNVLLACWNHVADMRPSFEQLEQRFQEFVKLSEIPESEFSRPFYISIPQDRMVNTSAVTGSSNLTFSAGYTSDGGDQKTTLLHGEGPSESDYYPPTDVSDMSNVPLLPHQQRFTLPPSLTSRFHPDYAVTIMQPGNVPPPGSGLAANTDLQQRMFPNYVDLAVTMVHPLEETSTSPSVGASINNGDIGANSHYINTTLHHEPLCTFITPHQQQQQHQH